MLKRGRVRERLVERVRRSSLLLSVIFAVLGALLAAVAVWWVLWLVLGAKVQTPSQFDLVKIAASVAAALGAVVALVVAYRKQRDGERGRFAELFGAAARQLGDADVAVRIAGVYALAGVADEFGAPSRRQQCIDVLCGYLRLPYEPESGADHLVQRTDTIQVDGVSRELRYQLRQNDREVRRAVVDVIVAHLRSSSEVSWSAYNFDFSGAVLEDADFRHAVFAGERTYFARAVFTGKRATTFEYAKFTGQFISFRDCVFQGASTLFRDVRFTPAERVDSELPGVRTRFEGAVFETPVSFDRAVFSGPAVIFADVTFAGERTSFAETVFRTERTEFGGATFDGTAVRFESAEFDSARISFRRARFYAARMAFDGARFGVRSRWRRSPTLTSDFSAAEYHGTVSFDDTVFDGREADFTGGDFFGEITFRRARFEAQHTRFDDPKAWVGVRIDWDTDPKRRPARVTPEAWPPIPAQPAP